MSRHVTTARETHMSFNASVGETLIEDRARTGYSIESFVVRHSVRRSLPYGIWTTADGTEYVFNREYEPMFKRVGDVNYYIPRDTWVDDIVSTVYLYDDGCSPVDFVCRHFKNEKLAGKEYHRACKRSLDICLTVLKKYTPKESGSVNSSFSVAKYR